MRRFGSIRNGLYMALCYVIISILVGCNSDNGNKRGAEVSYKDSLFLEIEGNMWASRTLMDSGTLFFKAWHRMQEQLYMDEGRFKWDIDSGADVKISENIFEYVTCEWIYQNKLIDIGVYRLERGKDVYRLVTTIMPPVDTINAPDPRNKGWVTDGVSYKDFLMFVLKNGIYDRIKQCKISLRGELQG